jgi:hypothetical protein
MGKPSRRPNREEIKALNKERKAAQKVLRAKQRAEGMTIPTKSSTPNRKSQYDNVEEEQEARQFAATEHARIFQSQLPGLLKTISKIKDLRNPKKIKYKMDLLMMYGILTFVFQMASRREANKEITQPQFMESLRLLFPNLDDIPHGDTLKRVLAVIEVDLIEDALVQAVKRLIKKKKFSRYLIQKAYPIAIDGSQKFVRDTLWSVECSEREVKNSDSTKMQYHVNVLEASLVFHNGMSIPLMSEFSNYEKGDTEKEKQDCEQKAFKRLAERLKKAFPRLSIILFLDGLYPNGPIVELCRKKRWDFMIVLQNKSLPSVWEEFEGLKKIETNKFLHRTWGDRNQCFEWVNNIEYYYESNGKKKLIFHMVICNETWEEIAKDSTETVTKKSRHVWISDKPLSKSNLHERCNLGARHRWGIESSFLVEKHHGYQYEHAFSYDWNAMRGYHYLMRLGHFLNVLAIYSECLAGMVREYGIRGFIKFIRSTLSGRWLVPLTTQQRLEANFQLRLI